MDCTGNKGHEINRRCSQWLSKKKLCVAVIADRNSSLQLENRNFTLLMDYKMIRADVLNAGRHAAVTAVETAPALVRCSQ